MKRLLLVSCALLVGGLAWADKTALEQVHDVYSGTLANMYYFDEYYQKYANRHGVSDFDNLTGEIELLRWGASYFDTGMVGDINTKWTWYNLEAGNPLNIGIYEINPIGMPEKHIDMVNPTSYEMEDLKYDPNYVDTEGMSVDDMFLMAIGGDEAVNASVNSNYQGDYKTAVGGRTEQEGFDLELAKQIAKNANKQAAADEEYRRMNASNTGGSNGGGGFWATLGKNFMMGLANMAANLPAEYARFQQEQAEKQRAIDAYNAQVDAYNKAQWQNYYNQVNAQNSGYSGGGSSSYSRPVQPQLTPAQRCELSCRNTGSPHLHHRGSHYSDGVCQCDVCDDRLTRC